MRILCFCSPAAQCASSSNSLLRQTELKQARLPNPQMQNLSLHFKSVRKVAFLLLRKEVGALPSSPCLVSKKLAVKTFSGRFRGGRLIRHFPVGLGRPDRPTPTGPFKIVAKVENPTWYVPRSIQEEMRREGQVVQTCVLPGPDNPLGKHWLGLSIPRFGIHGTNDPTSIYQFHLYGCVLAHNDDIAQLFDDVALGTAGRLDYRRLLIARVGDRVFLEIRRDIYQRQPSVQEQFEATIQIFDLESMIDRDLAQDIIRKQEGIARDISRAIGSTNSDETK